MQTTRQITMRAILLIPIALSVTVTEVSAKDTDIYLKSPQVSRDDSPNVLIIFDTSISMVTNSITTRPPYDPSTNYCAVAGAPQGSICNGSTAYDRVFWGFGASAPASNTDDYADSSKNKCLDSASALASAGWYGSSKIAGWISGNNRGWKALSNSNYDQNAATYIDCSADNENDNNATHDGLTIDDGQYPRNSTSTSYASNGSAFNWSNFTTDDSPTLYSANYLAYVKNSSIATSQTRLAIAKEAVKSIIDANKNVRFGLMVFNGDDSSTNDTSGPHGGRVVMKVDTMTDARRTEMKNKIDALTGTTSTPLTETLWEAKQYFAGADVEYGDNVASPSPVRDATAESGGKYVTPFKYGYQKSYIVYMTDGDPTWDINADSKVKGLSGLSSSTCTGVGNFNDVDAKSSCLKELAGWMQSNDLVSEALLSGNQTVSTFTIGFGSGISASGKWLLEETAKKGGGRYFAAADAAELSDAFQSALVEILQTNISFASPSLSINAFNRLFNRDDIYFALFKPSSSVGWDGNVKKFRLCNTSDVTTYSCKFGDVIDKYGAGAIDINSKIKDTSVSFWSDGEDGAEVTLGGAGSKVPDSTNRKVFTYLGSYAGLSATAPATSIAVEATTGNGLYDAAVSDPTVLGLPATATATDVTNLINWMRSQDSYDKDSDASTTSRWAFADPIHSRPLAITFGAGLTSGTPDPTKPITKIFVGTNDGAVRVINNDTGVEEWAFIPQEFLANQYNLSQDADGEHIYGMDGSPSVWVIDVDNDGIIEPGSGDRVYMYIGQRRNVATPNVRNIYAFDATPSATMTATTDVLEPKLMWVIQGGSGDFAQLGQTWSKPIATRVRFKCSGTECSDGNDATNDSQSRMVLLFAGGYDPNQDNAIPAGPDTMGNAIYMVDPKTGARLWWASSDSTATLVKSQMKYSIPSDLSLMDSNSDGATDRIYVGDTGGQIWRIDLGDQLDTDANGGTDGYVFADLGCTGGTRTDECADTPLQHRRKFFYPPAVAKIDDPNFSSQQYYDTVAIASGDREDPLDLLTTNTSPVEEAVHNRIYALRDYNYNYGVPATTPSPITDGDLVDVSTTSLDALTGDPLTNAKSSKGWRIDLVETTAVALPNGLTTKWIGEKGMSRAVIFGGVLYVTTFTPANDASVQQTCVASEGTAKVYAMNYVTAGATFDFNGDNTKERWNKVGGGIPSEVVIIIRPGGATAGVGVPGGMAQVPPPPSPPWIRTFWYDE